MTAVFGVEAFEDREGACRRRVRSAEDRQVVPLRALVGGAHRGMIEVAQLMEENIEKPLSLERIAHATGLSRRQIERLFRRHLDCVPKRYYLEVRLRRARSSSSLR